MPKYKTWLPSVSILLLFALTLVESLDAQSGKRGLGAKDGYLANSVSSNWGYDWGYNGEGNYNGEYVPMFWGPWGNINTKVNTILGYGNIDYVLGFNEPERANQANMSVETAVEQWREITAGFAGTGIKLVGPAPSDTVHGREWLDEFMAIVDADETLVVDEIAFHWYGNININNPASTANAFLNKVDQYHNNYGRNVWITEFAGIDWAGNYTDERMQEWNTEFLKVVLPGLDSRSYVTKYAWWNHNDDSRLMTEDSYGLWRPTIVGDEYVNTLVSGDTRDMNGSGVGLEMQYLRGGQLINNGSNLGDNAVGRIYAMANHDGSAAQSNIGGSGNFGLHNWGSVRVEENATLQKIGTGKLSFRNVDIYNDGQIRLRSGVNNAGILEISGSGSNLQGTGSIRVESQTTLALGRSGDTSGFALPYDLELRGGTVAIESAGIEISGNSMVFSQSTFEVNSDLVVSGEISGTAGIVKTGAGTMTLEGTNTYTGFTSIRDGLLLINGSVGGDDILVDDGGTLGGNGFISSVIEARTGSVVAPGNSTGTLTAEGAIFMIDSILQIEIASTSDYDRLVLNDDLQVDAGAIMEIIFLDGFVPEVGDQFDLFDFTSSSGSFDIVADPNITWDFTQFQSMGLISVTSVPEPGATVVLIGTALAFLSRRRKSY